MLVDREVDQALEGEHEAAALRLLVEGLVLVELLEQEVDLRPVEDDAHLDEELFHGADRDRLLRLDAHLDQAPLERHLLGFKRLFDVPADQLELGDLFALCNVVGRVRVAGLLLDQRGALCLLAVERRELVDGDEALA